MLSNRFYKSVGNLFTMYNNFGVCSMIWIGKERLFRKPKRSNKMMILTYLLSACTYIFTISQLFRFWKNVNNFNIVFTFFIAISIVDMSFCFTYGSGDYCMLVNSGLIFLRRINRKYTIRKYIMFQPCF